jgi:hypothetical protein
MVIACNGANENSSSTEQLTKTVEVPTESEGEYKIVDNSFMGIRPDDLIADHKDKLQSGKIKDGEQVREVLVIEMTGQELGYAVPNKEDKRKIGNITFQSPEVKTDRGIGVGFNLLQALEAYPNLEVKIAKKTKKVYAKEGEIAFLLDYSTQVESVDISKIPKDTKIVEIKLLSSK